MYERKGARPGRMGNVGGPRIRSSQTLLTVDERGRAAGGPVRPPVQPPGAGPMVLDQYDVGGGGPEVSEAVAPTAVSDHPLLLWVAQVSRRHGKAP